MKRPSLLLLCLALLLLFSSPANCLASGYTFTTFDGPLDWGLIPTGVNNSGQIVGYFGQAGQGGNIITTFSYFNSTFTTFSVTGAQETYAYGVSNSGKIVGTYYMDSSSYQQGFTKQGGTFQDLGSMCPSAISNSGIITGTYVDASSFSWFINSGSNYTYFDNSSYPWVDPKGINDSGQVIGMYYDELGNATSFYRSADGNFTPVLFPGTEFTQANAINDLGQIAGCYFDPLNSNYGLHGFIKTGDTYTTVDVPVDTFSWRETRINGINDSGEIVGTYLDAVGTPHGFIGTPTPIPPGLLLFGSGLLGLLGWRRCRRS
jgi:hypothetical protein